MNYICHSSTAFGIASTKWEASIKITTELMKQNVSINHYKFTRIEEGVDFYFGEGNNVYLTETDEMLPNEIEFLNEEKTYIKFGSLK